MPGGVRTKCVRVSSDIHIEAVILAVNGIKITAYNIRRCIQCVIIGCQRDFLVKMVQRYRGILLLSVLDSRRA